MRKKQMTFDFLSLAYITSHEVLQFHPFTCKHIFKIFHSSLWLNKTIMYIYHILWKTYSQHHTKWGKSGTISSKIRNEARVPTLPTLFQHSAGIPSQSNKTGERNTINREGSHHIFPICR
jgi:hypothetical protein